jgi:hypothetical protein
MEVVLEALLKAIAHLFRVFAIREHEGKVIAFFVVN